LFATNLETEFVRRQLATTKTPTDKTASQRQIDAIDRQIGKLVWESYRLTDREITIIENATMSERVKP